MQYLPAIVIGLLLLVIITRPFTVLFHELGHAIPVMILTKKGASIFIGSYGNRKQSLKLTIGGLEIWIRYNPLKWQGGLCIPEEKDISITKRIIYILCGPLLSLAITGLTSLITFSFDLPGGLKMICIFALGSSVFDLANNLIPRAVMTRDGSLIESDGRLLTKLFKLRGFPNEFAVAAELYNKKDYKKAAPLFEDFIARGLISDGVYRLAITCNIFIKDNEKAYALQKEFEVKYQPDSNDYYNFALITSALNLDNEQEHYLQKSLDLDAENLHSLNGMGYYLNTKQKFSEAIPYFNKAIERRPDFAYAFNNRGHAKIETGQLEDGLKDILNSIELDKENAYAYRNLGIYYLAKKEKEKALEYFIKAKQMGSETDLIDEIIERATASFKNS